MSSGRMTSLDSFQVSYSLIIFLSALGVAALVIYIFYERLRKVLYRNKCARVLTSAENACWVCETAFDEDHETRTIELERKKHEASMDELEKMHKSMKSMK